MKISKKSILIFFSGFVFALLVGVVVFIFLFLDHVNKYGLMFTPKIHSDQETREGFTRFGVELPSSANKLLYIRGDGIEPIYHLAFSASKECCEKYLKDFQYNFSKSEIKTFLSDLTKDSSFPPASCSLKWKEFTPRLYGKHDEEWPRDYWKINEVKEGFYLEDTHLFLLYDTVNFRIYIITYTT
jgi:hypothetical protein